MVMTDMYDTILEGVKCNIYTLNEARELCGLEPIRSEYTRGIEKNSKITNCVNCGAVIDPNVDHCEYCGTSYALMGVSCTPKKVSKRADVVLNRYTKRNTERRARLEHDRLQVENELLQAKTKALSDAEEIKTLYIDALNAMRSYRSRY
jgi:hypothetical protein